MQCILSFKGSFPCVKRDKTAAWGEREREREMSIRSNKEHFLSSSAWHHLSTLGDAEWMLRRKHPNGEEEHTFFFSLFQRWWLEPGGTVHTKWCMSTHSHTHTLTCEQQGNEDRNVEKQGCLFINPRVICEQLLYRSFTKESADSFIYAPFICISTFLTNVGWKWKHSGDTHVTAVFKWSYLNDSSKSSEAI